MCVRKHIPHTQFLVFSLVVYIFGLDCFFISRLLKRLQQEHSAKLLV